MRKLLSAAMICLMSFPLLAAVKEEPANAPVETVDMVYVVIFGIVFVGIVVGFFIYLWWSDKGDKKAD